MCRISVHHAAGRHFSLSDDLNDAHGSALALARSTVFPVALFSIYPQDLETLKASKNVLSTLPQNFTFLTSLTELDLSCNRFTDIPMLLCGMTALRQLDMTSNGIRCLPKEVGALSTLTKLHLRHNLLK